MSKKRMLADVLWEAANKHLEHDTVALGGDRWSGSCCAVARALDLSWPQGMAELAARHPVYKFLASLGCESHSVYLCNTPEPQSCRYMWLLLAMHVAEDEGIEL